MSYRLSGAGKKALCLLLGGIAVALTSCPEPAHQGDIAATPPVGAASTTAKPVTSTTATTQPSGASAASSAPVSSAVPAGKVSTPLRMAVAGSTRGTIACGSSRCKAPDQRCVLDDSKSGWSCVANPKHADANLAYVTPGFACDDGTDCPQGKTCCAVWEQGGAPNGVCVARKDVNRRCVQELCLKQGAHCLPGSGRSCIDSPDDDYPGICVAPAGPATCAGKRRCPKDKPLCAKGPSGWQCVALGSPEYLASKKGTRFQCTRQSDCHDGDRCQYAFGEIDHEVDAFCEKWNPMYRGTGVCEPGRHDICGNDADCRRMWGCEPAAPSQIAGPGMKLLPWMGYFVSK